MNREDIIRMAREAGFAEGLTDTLKGEVLVWDAETRHLERFAALVAAAETDRCILVLERNADKTLEEIIAAIRARENT